MTALTHADAVILAGGRATRMGGVDKPALVVEGRRMLDTALDAVRACHRTVVVGPRRGDLEPAILQTQETPPGAGPVAALAAGLAAASAEPAPIVVVLAADLPFVGSDAVGTLVDAIEAAPDAEAAFAIDHSGRLQFLFGVWRRTALAARINELAGALANQPMKALTPERYTTATVAGVADCDTPADLHLARTASASVPLGIDEARRAVRESVSPLPVRVVTLAESIGATLAEPLSAAEALPRFDVSAMDGYAVSGEGPWTLRTEIHYAGADGELALSAGEAVRIATGAHLPTGATAVLRDEYVDVRHELDVIRLSRRPDAPVRDDARRRGEDWPVGHLLAPAGTPVTPAVVSAAASAEVTSAAVRGPVRAHVVVTGDEIRRDGPLREGQTRDSLGPVLPQFLAWCGVRTMQDAHLRDTADSFDKLLHEAVDADVVVIVGATGGGAADQLRAALDRAQARTIVGRVHCRPGGSQLTSLLPDGRVVLGLPGNPFAAVATLLMMLPSIVAGLTEREPGVLATGPVANASAASGDVMRIVPAVRSGDGAWRCDTSVRTAHLAGLIGRDALALIPPGAVDGQVVELLPLL